MSFMEHDHILSLTSHLPHAIAYNIVRSVVKNGDNLKDEIIKYSAGGLRLHKNASSTQLCGEMFLLIIAKIF